MIKDLKEYSPSRRSKTSVSISSISISSFLYWKFVLFDDRENSKSYGKDKVAQVAVICSKWW